MSKRSLKKATITKEAGKKSKNESHIDKATCEYNAEFFNTPFAHGMIENFLPDKQFVHELKDELLTLQFNNKSNDLYQFQQTKDLIQTKLPKLKRLREEIFKKFKGFISNRLDIEFSNTEDLFCAKYENTDVLLCHDDELEGRRVAFIYYLVPQHWSKQDGGCLDLFETKDGYPGEIAKSLVPTFNSLVFFEVTENSFHQVSEVLSTSKTRLSLSGWLHGKPVARTSKPAPVHLPMSPPLSMEDACLLDWINPMYFNPEIVNDIQEQFEDDSQIQLNNFLLDEKYAKIEALIGDSKTKWTLSIIPNQRSYYEVQKESIDDTLLEQFLSLVVSIPFCKLLTKLTGLDLVNLDDDTVTSSCMGSMRRWESGCYTLLSDGDPRGKEYALDLIFNLNAQDWDSGEMGGFISYIARGEDEELLSVHPSTNCLSLVYRDTDTMRFHKYVNNKANTFYEVSAVYKENSN